VIVDDSKLEADLHLVFDAFARFEDTDESLDDEELLRRVSSSRASRWKCNLSSHLFGSQWECNDNDDCKLPDADEVLSYHLLDSLTLKLNLVLV
jgi:hypothetical protein